MGNKKTLKPGQLATVKSGEIFGIQGKTFEIRAVVRASKKVVLPCYNCHRQNNYIPCHLFMSVEKCLNMFGWDIFPIVVYEKTVFNT